jgi:hypothetical protein
MEAIPSSETSVLKRSTQSHIPEDGILHSHRSENHKSHILYNDDQVNADEMGQTCKLHEKDVHAKFWQETLKEGDQ